MTPLRRRVTYTTAWDVLSTGVISCDGRAQPLDMLICLSELGFVFERLDRAPPNACGAPSRDEHVCLELARYVELKLPMGRDTHLEKSQCDPYSPGSN